MNDKFNRTGTSPLIILVNNALLSFNFFNPSFKCLPNTYPGLIVTISNDDFVLLLSNQFHAALSASVLLYAYGPCFKSL